MKTIEIRRQNPERKVVAYETNTAVYVLGGGPRGGCYIKGGGSFSKQDYTDKLFREKDGSVKSHYTPLYEGDEIVIISTEAIKL